MRKRLIAASLVLCASALIARASRADDVKIGYVDTAKIFEGYKAAQDAQKLFDRDVEKWNRDLGDLKNDIAALRKELENQSLVLSDAKRREKEAALARKQSDYQSQVDVIWGPHGQATTRNADLVKSVIERIKAELDIFAQKENYTLILDSTAGHILYALKTYDVTEKVLTLLNSETTALPVDSSTPH